MNVMMDLITVRPMRHVITKRAPITARAIGVIWVMAKIVQVSLHVRKFCDSLPNLSVNSCATT